MTQVDFSIAEGCLDEARDLLRYLVRESGHELVSVHAGEVRRPSGLTGHQYALEIVAQVLSLVELTRGEVTESVKKLEKAFNEQRESGVSQ